MKFPYYGKEAILLDQVFLQDLFYDSIHSIK